MRPKTLTLVVFDESEAEWLIPAAADIARGFDAHMLAVHPYRPVMFYGGVGGPPVVFPTLADWRGEVSEKIKARFDDEARRADIRAEFRAQDTQYGAEPFLLSSARASDLVIVAGEKDGARSTDDRRLVGQLIRQSGRPVLTLPPGTALPGPASRILVGWSDTREATRAAHDAVALAAPRAEIDLLSVHGRPAEDPPGLDSRDDFAAALDRLGFRANVLDRSATADERAATLLAAARERGSQLVATGAFGHSQVYDFVIGAVTNRLLEDADVPLLMSK